MNINFVFDSFYKDIPESNVIPAKGLHSAEPGYNMEFLFYRPIKEMLTYNNDIKSSNNINFIEYNHWFNNKINYKNDKNLYFIQVRNDEFDSQWALNYIPKYIIDAANNDEIKIIFSCMYVPVPISNELEWLGRVKHKCKMIGLKKLFNLIFIWCDYRSTEEYQEKIKEQFKIPTEKITDPLIKDQYNNFQQTGYPKIVDSNIWERAIIPSLKKFNPTNENIISQYLNYTKEKLFLYFNNSQKDFRFVLYKCIEMHNLLEKSFYSYRYGDSADNYKLNNSEFFNLPEGNQILNYILANKNIDPTTLPDDELFRNSSRINGNKFAWDLPMMAAYCSIEQLKKTCFSLVCESSPHNHISEKVYKLFYYGHPFIVLGGKGYLRHLKKLGYKTFDFLFDESYDELEYSPKKLMLISNEIKKYSIEDGIEKFMLNKNQLEDVLEYNRNVFLNKDHSEFWNNI